MKKTMYVVYSGSVEINHGQEFDENVILDAQDPNELLITENKEEAIEYAKAKQPIMSVQKDMGTGVKYDLIEGLWVEEQDRTYDEDGDLVDTDNMGTWFISELPEA